MKKISACISISLFTLIALTNCSPQLTQQDVNRTVTLVVSDENIVPSGSNPSLRFEGQAPGTTLEDYTIELTPKEVVQWEGRSDINEIREVRIRMIVYESGSNLFRGEYLLNPSDNIRVVRARARRKRSLIGKEQKYLLFFKAIFQNGRERNFIIDPKIRMVKKHS